MKWYYINFRLANGDVDPLCDLASSDTVHIYQRGGDLAAEIVIKERSLARVSTYWQEGEVVETLYANNLLTSAEYVESAAAKAHTSLTLSERDSKGDNSGYIAYDSISSADRFSDRRMNVKLPANLAAIDIINAEEGLLAATLAYKNKELRRITVAPYHAEQTSAAEVVIDIKKHGKHKYLYRT